MLLVAVVVVVTVVAVEVVGVAVLLAVVLVVLLQDMSTKTDNRGPPRGRAASSATLPT